MNEHPSIHVNIIILFRSRNCKYTTLLHIYSIVVTLKKSVPSCPIIQMYYRNVWLSDGLETVAPPLNCKYLAYHSELWIPSKQIRASAMKEITKSLNDIRMQQLWHYIMTFLAIVNQPHYDCQVRCVVITSGSS